jgi:hypothetical protein
MICLKNGGNKKNPTVTPVRETVGRGRII